MHSLFAEILGLTAAVAVAAAVTGAASAEAPHFEPTWESLQQYQCPEWFRDAKFGIFLCWGPQALPGVDSWYARNMYIEGSRAYKYHLEHYGHPSKVGYKDVVKLWKAEKFDPDRLVGLFKEAGAKYVVPLAVHHDNFDLWNSKYHKWNAVNMGPQKDIIGMWREAILKQGLRFGVSEHLARSYSWFNVNKGSDKAGPYAGVPYDGNDPQYRDFYFEPHADTGYVYPLHPTAAWMQEWYDRITDLVDSYKPDLLYTDGAVPFGEIGRKLIAHFYNQNASWHNGKLEAVYNLKSHSAGCGEYRDGIGVLDVERGVVNQLKPDPWQTDTDVAGWYWTANATPRTTSQCLSMLVDIVSKNGNLLLNFALRPDGTLDQPSVEVLHGMGRWLKTNGEGIYGSRPWKVFGEGPLAANKQAVIADFSPFGPGEIRFTTKGRFLYVYCLARPTGPVRITSLGTGLGLCPERVEDVTLLGSQEKLPWERTAEALTIAPPTRKLDWEQYGFRIILQSKPPPRSR